MNYVIPIIVFSIGLHSIIIIIVDAGCPDEKSSNCVVYAKYYPHFCVDTPQNQWLLSEKGKYSCKKSCGLC